VGDFAEDFRLMDQFGQPVRLSDYCGQVVYIPMGAMWCPACQGTAEELPSLQANYGAQGLVILNVMAETPSGGTPTTESLSVWADTYDLDLPVLADPQWDVWHRYWPSESTPRELLVGRDGRLLQVGFVWESRIEDALED
jgi:peroxiredoxin